MADTAATKKAEADAAERYSRARAFDAEGARVGIITCLRCGAALLLDPLDEFDVRALHSSSHDA